jgi:RimJ/RimL family protein N-acetyltransferase
VETRPNVRKVGLAVLASNAPAIQLYERYGFIEEGRRRDEVRNDDGSYVDDILMRRFVNGGLSETTPLDGD